MPIPWSNMVYSPPPKKKHTPVSGGRKEGFQMPAEEDTLFDKAGLAGAKRPFLMARFEVDEGPAVVALLAARSRL